MKKYTEKDIVVYKNFFESEDFGIVCLADAVHAHERAAVWLQ